MRNSALHCFSVAFEGVSERGPCCCELNFAMRGLLRQSIDRSDQANAPETIIPLVYCCDKPCRLASSAISTVYFSLAVSSKIVEAHLLFMCLHCLALVRELPVFVLSEQCVSDAGKCVGFEHAQSLFEGVVQLDLAIAAGDEDTAR